MLLFETFLHQEELGSGEGVLPPPGHLIHGLTCVVSVFHSKQGMKILKFIEGLALTILHCSSQTSIKDHFLLIQCYYRRKPKLN